MEKKSNQNLQAEAMIEFVALQSKELAVKEKEINAGKHDSTNNKEIALASIEAQKVDRKEFRDTFERESSKKKWYFLALFVISIGFLIFLLQTGNKELASQIIKYASTIIISFVGGYGFGTRKNNSDNQE